MARFSVLLNNLDSVGGSRSENVSSGFFTNATAFLRGYRRTVEARNLINECKQAIINFDLDNDDCKKFKRNIDNCNISSLVRVIENTKDSLLKLDQDFASEYMSLLQESLQGVDYNSLSDEEKLEYNILSQDYDKTMFAMYAKLDALNCLSEEEKQYYDHLKLKNESYDIQDKMAVLDPRSKEYIELYKKNADLDRKIINSNPSLTDDQKKQMLATYNEQYNKNLKSLQDARNEMLKIERMEKELDDLYAAKDDNNGFVHPFVESEIEEAILDKEIALGIGMNTYSAYGDVHNAGMVFGNTFGHIGMSFACPWANAVLSGLEGMGSTAESVLANGGSYWEAMGRGTLSGIGGAFSGYAMSGLNANVTQFLKSGTLKTIGSTVINTIKNEGVKALVTGTWGAAKITGGTLGKLALTSLADADTWIETGCVFFDNILCGIADGEIDWGETLAQTGGVLVTEYAMNFLMGFAGELGEASLKHSIEIDAHNARQAELEATFNSPDADDYFYHYQRQAELESTFNNPDADDYFYHNQRQEEYDKLFTSPEADQMYADVKQAELEATFNSPDADDYFYHNQRQAELESTFNNSDADDYFNVQFQQTRDSYVDRVVAAKMDDAKYDYVKQQYELKNGKDTFWKLSKAEVEKLKSKVDVTTDSFRLKQAEYNAIANDTVNSILELKANGMIKDEYSATDVLAMIEQGVPQENYLSEYAIMDWKKQWSPDANGNVEVYCFQDSSNSYALKDGTVGRPADNGTTSVNPAGNGGAFVMTKQQYNALLDNRNIFDEFGNCKDTVALGKELGGVKFNGAPISIKQTIPLSSVELPMGNNKGAFLGDWRPGGKTSGGVIEGVVPQNFTNSSTKGNILPGTQVDIIYH